VAEQGFDAACVWALEADGAGVVVDWPASAEALYGVPAAEALGRPRNGPVRTEPLASTWPRVAQALRRAGHWEGELGHTLPDGGLVLTDTRLVLVPGEDGRDADPATGGGPLVVEIARDVTARRVTEEALRASEARLSAIIGSALDAILTVDEDQHVMLFNAAAERLFGVRAAEAVGESLDRFIPERYRAAHQAHVRAFGHTAEPGRTMSPDRGLVSPGGAPGEGPDPHGGLAARAGRAGTVLALRADGTEFPIEAAISKVDTPGGRLYTVVVRDVTERVQAEAERDRLLRALEAERARLAEAARVAEAARAEADVARRQAEAANHAKSAFLATMSHELRTPLNAVLGYAELLEMGIAGPVSAEQRPYLDRIAASGRHLLALVDDVLDLSKIEAGEMAVARQRRGIGEAVRTAVALVRPQAAERTIDLACEGCGEADAAGTGAGGGPLYLGDEHRVRQILANLLSNAVKYTNPGGRVSVACAPADAGPDGAAGVWVAVRVRDTGIGITAEHKELVFNRFHQVEQVAAGPYRRTRGGTGLGLAISRELARLMGGDLTLESEAGRGSTFTLWLPRADAECAPAAGPGPGGRAGAAQQAGLGRALVDAVPAVMAAWMTRLRADPLVPGAARLTRAELEDHSGAFLADFAQQFVILDDVAAPGASRVALVRDGAAVRQLLTTTHGRQRASLGWDEAALAREFTVLGEELERVLGERLADVPSGTVDDARGLVRTWIADAARESLAGMRAARRGASPPAAPPAPDVAGAA
jgi:signal transduction histidine kinase